MTNNVQLVAPLILFILHVSSGGVIVIDSKPSFEWFAEHLLDISTRFSNLLNSRHEIMMYSTQHVLNILEQYKLIISVIQELKTFMQDQYKQTEDSEAQVHLTTFYETFGNATAHIVSMASGKPEEIDSAENLRWLGNILTDVCKSFKMLSTTLPNRPKVIDDKADELVKYFSKAYIDNETASIVNFLHDLRKRHQ